MDEFIALVFKVPTGFYLAIFPDLPACVAFSETFEGVGPAATAALGTLLVEMQRMGESIPLASSLEAVDADTHNNDRLASLKVVASRTRLH